MLTIIDDVYLLDLDFDVFVIIQTIADYLGRYVLRMYAVEKTLCLLCKEVL